MKLFDDVHAPFYLPPSGTKIRISFVDILLICNSPRYFEELSHSSTALSFAYITPCHYSNVTSASGGLKSPTTILFIQQFSQTNIEDNDKAQQH